jgi:hypothetical protein
MAQRGLFDPRLGPIANDMWAIMKTLLAAAAISADSPSKGEVILASHVSAEVPQTREGTVGRGTKMRETAAHAARRGDVIASMSARAPARWHWVDASRASSPQRSAC